VEWSIDSIVLDCRLRRLSMSLRQGVRSFCQISCAEGSDFLAVGEARCGVLFGPPSTWTKPFFPGPTGLTSLLSTNREVASASSFGFFEISRFNRNRSF
jgi:hypothetical protein